LLLFDWTILSSNCGFVQSEKYDFCNSYQAILISPIPAEPQEELTMDELIEKASDYIQLKK
jgi:hypothetical protein